MNFHNSKSVGQKCRSGMYFVYIFVVFNMNFHLGGKDQVPNLYTYLLWAKGIRKTTSDL